MASFEELDHTADWALRIRGEDMADLFRAAASAMLAACGARPGPGPELERSLTLEAPDRESLLVAWLEEVLYSLEVRRRLPTSMTLGVSEGNSLEARWRDVPLAGLEKPIKAVTYNDLAIEPVGDGFEATVVFDV